MIVRIRMVVLVPTLFLFDLGMARSCEYAPNYATTKFRLSLPIVTRCALL